MALPFQDCIVLLGDSLTQRMDSPGNLHQRFAEAYQRKLDIQNRGFGGYTTAWSLPLFDYIFAKKGETANTPVVRLVTIWFGTNDSVLPGRDQHLSLEEFTTNMNKMFDALTSPDSPYAVADTPVSIVLITPGPPYPAQMEQRQRDSRSAARTKEFRDEAVRLFHEWKAREAQSKWKLGLVDMWDEIVKAAGGEGDELAPFYFDGLHLTTRGYTVVWDKLSQVIRTEFKGRGLDYTDFDDLPRRVPLSTDIDPARPESVVERMALPKIRGGSGAVKVEGENQAFEG